MAETKDTDIAQIYFHIGNGGIAFEVLQAEHAWEFDGEPQLSKAPVLTVTAHHFGQQTNNMRFQLSPEALKLLGETLIKASECVVVKNEVMLVENPRRVRFGDTVVELDVRGETLAVGSAEQT